MTVTRIGSNQSIPIDVRVVAATNRDLREMVKNGFFREDLYFRLGVLNVDVPPLRDRKEDLLQLAEALLSQSKDPMSSKAKRLSADSEKILEAYDWPGNVRELRNVLSRAGILSRGEEISAETLKRCIDPTRIMETEAMQEEGGIASAAEKESISYDKVYQNYLDSLVENADAEDDEKLAEVLQESQKKLLEVLIRKALEYTGGNKKRAAELLWMSRKTLYNIMSREKWDV